MDIEGDNFRTIHEASAGRSTDWAKRSHPGMSLSPHDRASYLDETSCLSKAKAICGCYRRDEAQDPETFAAALALVFGDYPADIVNYAADPRTGIIIAFPMGLPNVGQVKAFLDDVTGRQERIKRYSKLPKFEKSAPISWPKREPGTSYHEMFEKHGRPIGRFEEIGDKWNGGAPLRTIERSRRLLDDMIRQEYEVAGLQPILGPGGDIISLGLARLLGKTEMRKTEAAA